MNIFKPLKAVCLLASISIILSCKSDLSSGKVENITLIGANIEINQNPFDKAKNGIIVDLFDDNGRKISNDSIKVIVNTIEIKINHRQGLYYIDESNYLLSNLPVNEIYTVEIQLSDGKKYFLGSVKALAVENTNSIEYNEKGDLNKNTIIKWNGFKDIDELSIMTSVLLKTSTAKMMNYEYRDEIIKKIDKTGKFVFLKSDYSDSKSNISGLELKFRTTKFGKLNHYGLKVHRFGLADSKSARLNCELILNNEIVISIIIWFAMMFQIFINHFICNISSTPTSKSNCPKMTSPISFL